MAQGTVFYSLSEAGRKASLLAGGDGREQQTISGELTADNIDLFAIDDGGIARAAIGDLVMEHPRGYDNPGFWKSGRSSPLQDAPPTWEQAVLAVQDAASTARAKAAEKAVAEEAAMAQERMNIAHNAAIVAEWERGLLADPAARMPGNTYTGGVSHEIYTQLRFPPYLNDILSAGFRSEMRRRKEADEAEAARGKADALKVQLALVSEFVATHGTASQIMRYEAGLLPSLELKELIAADLFSGLAEFPRYAKMRAICGGGAENEDDEHVEFSNQEATEVPPDTWDTYQAIKAAAGESVSIEIRLHHGRCECEGVPVQERFGVKVVKALGSRNIAREFAA